MNLYRLIKILRNVINQGCGGLDVYVNGIKLTEENIRIEVKSKPNRVLILTKKD